MHPQIINDQFKLFYGKLYTSQTSTHAPEKQAFLDGLPIPKISLENQPLLVVQYLVRKQYNK